MRVSDTSDLWWKSAVIYCLDVKTFMDWNNDGTGDLQGLAQRLDYLADLGVTCLWLMPFYPSPGFDDGYDVADYYGVDPKLGTHGDLVEVIRTARDRGMRVIADLVANHTSEQHPWFRSARASPNSPYRDFYVWRDTPPADSPEPMFPEEENDVWTYDEKAEQYYQHRFHRHQPDLNLKNPRVREELGKVIGFWLQLGLSGFRVDSVPYFVEDEGGAREDFEGGHDFLRDLQNMASRRMGDSMLLGEVNLPYDDQYRFFGREEGDELTMQFDFVANQSLYLSLARGDARPFASALQSRPELAQRSQWANFVRNHDELNLDQLSPDEREEVFAVFAPEEDMKIFGRGIRRRLPPMLDGDPRRVRMVYSLLFSTPGSPVLYYGEEIGMGENLEADGRKSSRTPMQWDTNRHGGFSGARRDRLITPPTEGAYGPEFVNADHQIRDHDSLLHFMRLLISRYRSSPEIGWGELQVLDQPNPEVLAHRMSGEMGSMIAVHNFSAEPQIVPVTVEDADEDTRLYDLLEDGITDLDRDGSTELTIGPYGYRWLRVTEPGSRRIG